MSDLHLGSEVCQRDKIIEVLKHLKAETLILAGDVIDIDHLKRLSKKDWKILSLLRKLSKTTHIIYIRGNHDSKIADIISDLLGFEFRKNYDFTIDGKKFHVLHGDEFDTFVANFPILTEIATGIYYFIQLLSPKKQVLARIIKRRSKNFIKSCENTKHRAEKYAETHEFHKIICGHVHQWYINNDSKYINTGCFTEVDCSYLEINNLGNCVMKFI